MALSDDVADLYQEIILEHNRQPRNFGPPGDADGFNRHAEGYNPLCGDQYTVYLKINDDDVVEAVAFTGDGCAISKASASVMTQTVKGRPVEEALALFEEFHDVVAGPSPEEVDVLAHEGDIGAFAGLRNYPTRVKCGTLAWHTLKAALEGKDEPVRTE